MTTDCLLENYMFECFHRLQSHIARSHLEPLKAIGYRAMTQSTLPQWVWAFNVGYFKFPTSLLGGWISSCDWNSSSITWVTTLQVHWEKGCESFQILDSTYCAVHLKFHKCSLEDWHRLDLSQPQYLPHWWDCRIDLKQQWNTDIRITFVHKILILISVWFLYPVILISVFHCTTSVEHYVSIHHLTMMLVDLWPRCQNPA